MRGSKQKTMTPEQMRAAIAAGHDQTDWARLQREVADDIEPPQDDAAPDAAEQLLAAASRKRAGRPAGSGSKDAIALRLDRDILTAFRASGPGWQTRINQALRDWLREHPG